MSFTTRTDTLIDVEGNIYFTQTIGTQIWMSENLKTTKFNDKVDIPLVTSNSKWEAISTPAYCWYNNNIIANKETYGALYNWYAVNTGKLCPTGWHVPTDNEWTTLTTYLGGENVAGDKLKETGTTHWASPNTSATNSSGFIALPGGSRYNGTFINMCFNAYFWSSTEYNNSSAWFRSLYHSNSNVHRYNSNKESGFSVRCLRD